MAERIDEEHGGGGAERRQQDDDGTNADSSGSSVGRRRRRLPWAVFESKLKVVAPQLLHDFESLRLFAGLRTHPPQWLMGVEGSGSPWHFHQDACDRLAIALSWVPPDLCGVH